MPLSSLRIARSQGEDIDVTLSGTVCVEEDALEIVLFNPVENGCTTARVMRAVHSFETGLLALLYWERADEHDLILPIEGKGALDFRDYNGLMNPRAKGWTGRILMRVTSLAPYQGSTPRHFALALDLSKQRS